MRLRYPAVAQADLAHIRETIRAQNQDAAERVRKSILQTAQFLKFFPHIGKAGATTGTREKAVKSSPYLIVYTIKDTDLIVLRIYYGAQNRP